MIRAQFRQVRSTGKIRLLRLAALCLVLGLALLGVQASQAQTIRATTLSLVSPAACPPSGCAAGQTVDLRATFDLAAFDPAVNPNVQVCLYTQAALAAESFRIDTLGAVTGAGYQPGTANCLPGPDGYATLGGATAQVSTGAFGDMLNLGFRIGRTATAGGSILLRIYQQVAGSGWVQSDQSFAAIPVTPTAATVYVANDASACGNFSPCYLNSGSDRANGLGTGLKDAVDAQPGAITVLGSYTVKGNSVLVDQPVTLQGLNDSRITYQGSTCSEPLLRLANAVTLRSLTVTDGACTSPNRDLIAVESGGPVVLEYLDLLAGQTAVNAAAGSDVKLRFSQVANNAGYALFRVPGDAGTVQVSGNNLTGNRSGVQVDCGGAGTADHNFWGAGILANSASANCAANDDKRLGAPILPRASDAGVQGELVTVTTGKQSSFSGLVSYQHSPEGAGYQLNIVNHGAGAPENVPFTGGAPGSLTACSNYYDVFLENGAAPAGSLDLSLRYDRTSGCTTAVESASFCASTNPANFPLWWYSPSVAVPSGWNTAGSSGQTVTCDTAAKEIRVNVDASGRPNFLTDLNFTPFVVGLPSQPASVVITRFEAIPGVLQAAIQWTTASEVNTSGFYVLRSLAAGGPFERVSSFIAGKGSGAYEFVDTGLANFTTYYYRLEILTNSQGSTFSQVISTTIGGPTSTATQTLTPTPTATVTGTITPTGPTPTPTGSLTVTRTRTITPTRVPTRTRTQIRYATFYQFKSPTRAPSRTPFPTRTVTATRTLFPGAQTSTAQVNNTLLPQGSPTLFATPTLNIVGLPSSTPTPESATPDATAIALNPGLALTQEPEPTTALIDIIDVPTNQERPQQPNILTFPARNWPWMLGLLGLELGTLGAALVFLRRRGWLKMGAVPRQEEDSSHSDDENQAGS